MPVPDNCVRAKRVSLLDCKQVYDAASAVQEDWPSLKDSSCSDTFVEISSSSLDDKHTSSEASSASSPGPLFTYRDVTDEDDNDEVDDEGYDAEDHDFGADETPLPPPVQLRRTSTTVLRKLGGSSSTMTVMGSRRHSVSNGRRGSRRLRTYSATTSSTSDEEEEEMVATETSRRRKARRRPRKEKQSKDSFAFVKSPHTVKVLTFLGLASVSITMMMSHSAFLSSELADLEHPTHMKIMFRNGDGEDRRFGRPRARSFHLGVAGLRGKMVPKHAVQEAKLHTEMSRPSGEAQVVLSSAQKAQHQSRQHAQKKEQKVAQKAVRHTTAVAAYSSVVLPKGKLAGIQQTFDNQDRNLYKSARGKASKSNEPFRRMVLLHGHQKPAHRSVEQYPSPFTDQTQLYSVLDSSDERINHMELRQHLDDGECKPMKDWQTTFYPSCNGIHEMDLANMGEANGDDYNLFGTKGYWRNAWRVDSLGGHQTLETRDTVVLKTLKIQHRFEEAHFEHDRVDAVAMERLTSSPHVINIFGYCGHSVMTEFADGKRLGHLADKSRRSPLARLKIARNIAEGLADMHGIDGDRHASFVHLDVNPANVVSVNGTLKLNDFNIGILRRWNTTSDQPCGFPAQYPNPQWRSPEEARNEQHLTEKVDVFSLGHILFRLICGHEPWNKLEPGGRPPKEVVTEKVKRGVLPFIPEEVRKSTNSEVIAIREAMLKCYTFDPLDRPSARDIYKQLQTALDNLEKNAIA